MLSNNKVPRGGVICEKNKTGQKKVRVLLQAVIEMASRGGKGEAKKKRGRKRALNEGEKHN